MKPIEIAEKIYWVGVVDWNIRDFHGYSTYQGSTYNAYLIMDEKITLIDTVKREFADELLANISRIVDPRKIDYVISNHTEMDHSGALPRVMHRVGENKPLYCSKMGHKNLSKHFFQTWNYQPVENGGQLSLGKRTLTFMETRMLHWPDSMFTYVNEDKILFSSDGFGQHYAGLERFDDEIGDAYVEWSRQKPKRKAVVIYDTMWHSTETMAETLVEALGEAGVEAKPFHLRGNHRSDIMTEVLDAGAIIVGSPTLNNGLYPTISDFLTYMKGLKPKNKVGAAFGSYGWSGEAVKLINKELELMKFDIIDPGLRIQYLPDEKGLAACRELAGKIAGALPLEKEIQK